MSETKGAGVCGIKFRIEPFEKRLCFVLPTPWLEADIGAGMAVGSGSLSAGTFNLSGAGDIANTADKLRFSYQRLAGDGYVIARVADIQSADPLAEVGVMIRENLTPGSKFADMIVRDNGETRFGFRLSNAYRIYDRASAELPSASWIKLTRTRNTIVGYASADGQEWTRIGAENVTMASDAYIGLFVTSNSLALASAQFTNVTIPQNIIHYGASVDLANNVPAIQSALAASANSGNEVYVPPGTFKTTAMVELSGAKRLFGAGQYGISPYNSSLVSSILSTNSSLAPVHLTGSGGRLNDIQLTTTYTGSRLTSDRTTAVYANTASNFVISGVEVMKSASGGFMISHGANNGLITRNRVHDTLADGIHVTNGSYQITVENNIVYRTGDDLIASVGYDGKFDAQGNQWAPPTDITIRNNNTYNTGMTHGRGIAAVGSKNVLIDNNTITDAAHTGIIIVSENAYSSLAGDGIIVTRNRVINPNTQNLSGSGGNHGGIYIGGRNGFPITNVMIGDPKDPSLGNIITNAKGQGVNISTYTSGIRVYNNNIDTVTGYGVRVNSSSNVEIANNTIRRSTFHGIYVHGSNSGAFSIAGNLLDSINSGNSASNDAIHIATGSAFSTLSIIANHYINPAGYVVDRFIECHFPAAIVSDNTTTTGKPIYVGI